MRPEIGRSATITGLVKIKTPRRGFSEGFTDKIDRMNLA